jgi:hypothetical protein
MNYADLCTNIQEITENSFTSNQLAMFTQQAEQKIYNTVQIANLRKNATGATSASNKYLACPNDFLSPYSLAVVNATGEYSYLLNKDVNFIREAYSAPTSTGLPKYYAIFGPASNDVNELTFLLGPTPDAIYTVEMHYYYYPPSISTAGTSWLGDNFDSALLNGALIEAIRFMKGEADIISNYEKLYLQSIQLLKQLGDGKQRQDAYRSGQFRQAVT